MEDLRPTHIEYRTNIGKQLFFGALSFLGIVLVLGALYAADLWRGDVRFVVFLAIGVGLAAAFSAGLEERPVYKRIFILLGHPDKETLNGALADAYQKGAKNHGHEVRRMNIGDMRFDPILHKGYKEIQELEGDLKTFQANMKWADHFVLFYPNWWSSMPALLKGLFDRSWLPGFGFHFTKFGWVRLLKGRSGRVFLTLDNIPFIARFVAGDYTNEIRNAILRFSGIAAYVTKIGAIKYRSENNIASLISKMEKRGKNAD